MISIRQLDANRRNAQLSTGPQTPEGRAAVRHNALTHGLTAQDIVFPKENKQEFEDFFASFDAEYQPAGPTENLLLKQVVINAWRLERLQGMETSFFELGAIDCSKSLAERYKNTDAHDLHAFVFRNDAREDDVLSRLARYESRLQRSFYKALHELQRLQELRATPANAMSDPETPPVSPAPDSTPDSGDPTPDPTPPTSAPPETGSTNENLKNQTHSQFRTPPPVTAETQQCFRAARVSERYAGHDTRECLTR